MHGATDGGWGSVRVMAAESVLRATRRRVYFALGRCDAPHCTSPDPPTPPARARANRTSYLGHPVVGIVHAVVHAVMVRELKVEATDAQPVHKHGVVAVRGQWLSATFGCQRVRLVCEHVTGQPLYRHQARVSTGQLQRAAMKGGEGMCVLVCRCLCVCACV
jgi:hypothetical protein